MGVVGYARTSPRPEISLRVAGGAPIVGGWSWWRSRGGWWGSGIPALGPRFSGAVS